MGNDGFILDELEHELENELENFYLFILSSESQQKKDMSKKGGGGGGDGKKGKKRGKASVSSQSREPSVEVVDKALPAPAVPPEVDFAQQVAPQLMDMARQMASLRGSQFIAPVPGPTILQQQLEPVPQLQPQPVPQLHPQPVTQLQPQPVTQLLPQPRPASATPPSRPAGRQVGCRHRWRNPPNFPAHESQCRKCRLCGRVEMLDWVVVKKEGPVTPSPQRDQE